MPFVLAPRHSILQNRIVHVHLVLVVHELLAQRGQLLGGEAGHLGAFPQFAQLLVLEEAPILVRIMLVFAVLSDAASVCLVVLVLFRVLRVVKVLEDVVRGHDPYQLLTQCALLEAVFVLVLAVQLFPGQLFLVVDLQVGEERLQLGFGETLCGRTIV